jgi:hypothetical protein
MSEFILFTRLLREAGFRKTYQSRAGGAEIREWRREDADGRTLVCQLWQGGNHRITHEWCGCSNTPPTLFNDKLGFRDAILREALRTDGKYRDPMSHHDLPAQEFLMKRRALAR